MRRSLVALAGAATVILALSLAGPPPAGAHSLLQASDPAPNAVLAASPATVLLAFTEAPDPGLSSIRVLDSSGREVAAGSAQAVSGQPDQLRLALPLLPDGVYTVAWRTVSAVDGHAATGSYAFSIGTGAAPPAPADSAAAGSAPGSSAPSPGAVIGHWLLYLGLLGLLGAAFAWTVVARGAGDPGNITVRLAVLDWFVALAGTVLLLASQASDAGMSLMALPGTSLGRDAALRIVPLVPAAVGLVTAVRSGSAARLLLFAVIGVIAALAFLFDAALSHAAAESVPFAEIVVQWLHLLAVGLWLGGLVALLLDVRGSESPTKADLAHRFARLGVAGLAVVVVTGIARTIVEVGTLDALVSTDFGRLVLAKVALLVPVALLGALNHFRNVPAAGRTLRPLRRAGSVELVIGAVLLLIASALGNIAPPVEVAAAAGGASAPGGPGAPAPISVSGADLGTTVRLQLTITPGSVGSNSFSARVTDHDTGAAVAATGLRLAFTLRTRPGIGASTLDLQRQADGTFSGSGANLSMDGTWRVAALVTQASTAAEVDLEVTVHAPPQQVDISRAAGLPTIYTVHLGAGRTVQVYLDPGTVGPNQLHATWFGADGSEMAVSGVTLGVSGGGGVATSLTPVILSAGHETAPLTVGAFPVSVLVTAVGPDGTSMQVQLQIASST